LNTLTHYREHLAGMAKLGSAISLLGWDQHTHMPPKASDFRAQVIGKLTKLQFELLVGEALSGYLSELRQAPDLSPTERGSVRRVGKNHDRNKAIPASLIEAQSIAQSEAQSAWVKARKASDFAVFLPHLKKMVEFARKFAEYYGYEEHPYDALMEDYEPGMTCKKLRQIIDPLREALVPFLKRLVDEGAAPNVEVLQGSFDTETQRRMAHDALERIGYDFDAGGLDNVAHPFTTTIGPGDVRITNRYLEKQLLSGLFGALHEGGHALYNQGMPEELFTLGLASGSSNGIHESQSRMIENQIGRSRPFWSFFQPILARFFPQFASASPEDLYRAANVVAPSLIRVEADEVTYNFHIMLRFELEAGLIDGTIAVDELPSLWNDAMKRYLGVVPPNDAQGVLQDVHWSMGAFGYFPSYMLGNLYAAQMLVTLREELPTLDGQIEASDFAPLLGWLREKVHRWGATYDPDELIERITGHGLTSAHFVRYVTEKYSEIYRLK
jgi:carboxypeptidase Taq